MPSLSIRKLVVWMLIVSHVSVCFFQTVESSHQKSNLNLNLEEEGEYVSSGAAPAWVAIFLSPSEKLRCQSLFFEANLNSSIQMDCDHTTIIYNPPSLDPYIPYYGAAQTLQTLAYAIDDHDQTLLVRIASGPVLSTNLYPHITVSCYGQGIYGAQYSIVVWERLVDNKTLDVEFGSDKQPQNVSLLRHQYNDPNKYSGWLPPFQSVLQPIKNNGYYAATNASVEIFPMTTSISIDSNLKVKNFGYSGVIFKGTLCVNYLWNEQTGLCNSA